jgi:hypothetical protein
VLTTPTPAEFADPSDLGICKQRPSPVTQGLGVSAFSKLTLRMKLRGRAAPPKNKKKGNDLHPTL